LKFFTYRATQRAGTVRRVMPLLTAVLAASIALGAAAEEVQLLPAGEFAARDGRPGAGKKWRVIDAQGEALAAEFNREAGATPIVVDYDHHTLYVQRTGQKALAAGWMSGATWRKGQGLWARVKWTPAARQHIESGEYAYLSPVLLYDSDTGAVAKVAMAALVNYPGLLGMEPVLAQLATQFPHVQPKEHLQMNPILAALLSSLGLKETATEQEALAALAALKARPEKPGPAIPAALATELGVPATVDEATALAAVVALKKTDGAALTAMAALQTQLAELSAKVVGAELNATVDRAIADGKLVPAQRDWALGLGRKDMASLSAYIASAPPLAGLGGQSGGKGPGQLEQAALAADEEHVRVACGFTPEQWAKAKAKPKDKLAA
jgi:phage I-like protein